MLLIAASGPWHAIIRLFVLAVAHIPVIEKHLVKQRLLLVFAQQTALERVVKVLFTGQVDIVQGLHKVQHFAWPYVDAHLPQNTPELHQAGEQALATLDLVGSQRGKRGREVIAVRGHVHHQETPCAFFSILFMSLPPIFRMSSWYFSSAPSVSRTEPSTSSS